MEVLIILTNKYERHHLVPCSYKDYETALKEEMPSDGGRRFRKFPDSFSKKYKVLSTIGVAICRG